MHKLIRKRTAVLAVAGLAASLVSACGASNSTHDAPKKAGAIDLHAALPCDESPTPDELLNYPVPKANKPYKITMMEVSLAGYYYQGLAYGATQAAKEAGVDLTVVAGDGYTSAAPQLAQAEDVLQKGTDAIILAPIDAQGSVPIVTKAKAKNVPVIDISTEVSTPDVAGSVLQDDYLLGKAGADELIKQHPDGGNGIVLAGPPNATWSLKRFAGFMDEIKKHPEFKVVASPQQPVDPAKGLQDFTDATTAHPDVDWIYSVFYYQMIPDSIPAQYKGKTFITTGYEPAAIDSLKKGTLTATAPVQNVNMGRLALAQAVDVLNGNKGKSICLPAPSFTKADIGTPVANSELYPADFKVGQ